jgi:AraC-like DNA-binding protein
MAKFLSIGFGSYRASEFHSHHCSEISVYTSGRGEAMVGREVRLFRPGTIILYPPEIPHRERSAGGYSEFWIAVEGLEFDGLPGAFQDTPQKTFTNLARLLHDEHYLGLPPAKAATQEILDLIIVHLQRMRAQPEAHPQVSRLRHLLAQNVGNAGFDLPRALRDFPLSPGHLRTLFRRGTGKTPTRYLLELRLQDAKHLLRQGYSVKEAAYHVGFEDPYHFSRRFHAWDGQWPSAFKR